MNTELLVAYLLGGIFGFCLKGFLNSLRRWWRNATPREPNPEPRPQMTPELLDAAAAWGREFEAAGVRVSKTLKTGRLSGFHLEREGILEALKLCRGELKAIRAQQVKAGYGDAFGELDLKYAEYMDYSQRLADVDQDIEEWAK